MAEQEHLNPFAQISEQTPRIYTIEPKKKRTNSTTTLMNTPTKITPKIKYLLLLLFYMSIQEGEGNQIQHTELKSIENQELKVKGDDFYI
jgi:hypothetical protein